MKFCVIGQAHGARAGESIGAASRCARKLWRRRGRKASEKSSGQPRAVVDNDGRDAQACGTCVI